MIRVVLVDDQELVRTGLAMILDADPDFEVVGEAGDGATGLSLFDELGPDLVVLDIRMPDLDGLEVAKRIRRTHPGVAIAIFSAFADALDPERARDLDLEVYEKTTPLIYLLDRLDQLVQQRAQ